MYKKSEIPGNGLNIFQNVFKMLTMLVQFWRTMTNTRIAEVGVAFQHCKFFFQFFNQNLKKTFFHLFYSNFFNIISEKKVKIFFFKYFFEKCFLKN